MDEDAAKVVKRIFDLCIAGYGPSQIARVLEAESVLTTKAYNSTRKGKPLPGNPYHWNENSVAGILERMEYNGCTCNFKTYSKSYKLKKRIPNSEEDMVIILDAQEPIVSREQWDRVQELRKNKQRPAKAERQGHFPDCLSAPTAAVNCTLLSGGKMTANKTTTFVPITKAIGEAVQRTISVRKCFKSWFWNVSEQSMNISGETRKALRKNG